jgi:hypothetical protein
MEMAQQDRVDTENTAVVAPIPSASAATAAKVNAR